MCTFLGGRFCLLIWQRHASMGSTIYLSISTFHIHSKVAPTAQYWLGWALTQAGVALNAICIACVRVSIKHFECAACVWRVQSVFSMETKRQTSARTVGGILRAHCMQVLPIAIPRAVGEHCFFLLTFRPHRVRVHQKVLMQLGVVCGGCVGGGGGWCGLSTHGAANTVLGMCIVHTHNEPQPYSLWAHILQYNLNWL